MRLGRQSLEGLLAQFLFQALNLVTLGNFPPLAAVAAVVERDSRLLVIQRADGRGHTFPGGMLRWEETVGQALLREVREETGYLVAPQGLVGIYSGAHRDERLRSVLIVYRAALTGGALAPSFEGTPLWLPPAALRGHMAFDNEQVLDDYLSGVPRFL